jgi:protein TonB
VNNAPNGKYNVIISHTVEKDGSLTDIKALTNFGYGMEQECLRFFHSSPKWIPAMLNGVPLVSVRKQPITFIIKN